MVACLLYAFDGRYELATPFIAERQVVMRQKNIFLLGLDFYLQDSS
jgi:hypothetical protein